MPRANKESTIALLSEAEAAAKNFGFIKKKLSKDRKSFDGPLNKVNGRLIIHDKERLKNGRNISPPFLMVQHPRKFHLMWIKWIATITPEYRRYLQTYSV